MRQLVASVVFSLLFASANFLPVTCSPFVSSALAAQKYAVKRGDTLIEIAHKFNISVNDIKKANPHMKASNLKIGQKLTIPTKGSSNKTQKTKAGSTTTSASTYTVRSGDNLTSIGKKLGVKPNDISKANGNIKSNKLKVGQKLTIPGVKSSQAKQSGPPEKTIHYKVEKGDTLSSISRKFNVSITKIRQANSISGNEIMSGQRLTIPGKADRTKLAHESQAAKQKQQKPQAQEQKEQKEVAAEPVQDEPAQQEVVQTPSSTPEEKKNVTPKASEKNMSAVDYYTKGNDLGLKKKYNAAIKEFDKAIALDPKNPTYFASRGHAHYYRRNYKEAIQDYTDAIKLDDTFALAYSMRGLSYTRTGDYKQAIADYNKAIDLSSQDADFYKGRGYAYYHLKQYGPMCQDYEKACQLGDCQLLNTSKEQGLCKTP